MSWIDKSDLFKFTKANLVTKKGFAFLFESEILLPHQKFILNFALTSSYTFVISKSPVSPPRSAGFWQ